MTTDRPGIDVTFDFRSDTKPGKDPDRYSKTLRRYHATLWSKPLPDGALFELSTGRPGCYLYHRSDRGEFFLSSDAVIPTFRWSEAIQQIITATELEAFNAVGYTVGGMMLFPGNRIDGKWTINQARGCRRGIRDRFDLTLECIRRHYSGDDSPLADVLDRYHPFFELFGDFKGYVDFFLLQDVVSEDYRTVKTALPIQDFRRSPVPSDRSEYDVYRRASIDFIEARNARILAYSLGESPGEADAPQRGT